MPEFSDISDEELVQASANVDIAAVDVVSTDSQHVDKIEFSDISDDEFIKLPVDSESCTKSRLRKPVSSQTLRVMMRSEDCLIIVSSKAV